MLKNKLSTSLFAAGMAIIGMIAGTAILASAQTLSTNAITPNTASVHSPTEVDTPEAGDVADTPGVPEKGQDEHMDKGNDNDGTEASEASEPAGSSDASDK